MTSGTHLPQTLEVVLFTESRSDELLTDTLDDALLDSLAKDGSMD